jgi:hypothetical protein
MVYVSSISSPCLEGLIYSPSDDKEGLDEEFNESLGDDGVA